MAEFRIFEDNEKENPNPVTLIIKEKNIADTNAGGGLGIGIAHDKLQQLHQERPKFAVLNSNNDCSIKSNIAGGGALNKTKFLNANRLNNNNNNNNLNDDKAGYQNRNKKPKVAHQLMSFSVYEDQPDEQNQAAATATITSSSPITQRITMDKENMFFEQHKKEKRKYHVGTLEPIHIDLPTPNEEDYVVDTSPSVSVDRAHEGNINNDMLGDDQEAMVGRPKEDGVKTAVEQENQTTSMNRENEHFFGVPEYQNDILEYLRESEKTHRPKPNYMSRQPEINYTMRAILVDWLVEVSEDYKMNTQTLYLSVSYIDRFLSQMSVVRSKLQLVGAAAILIAAKFEEIHPLGVSECVYLTADTFTKEQVLRMEQIMLRILTFDLCTPTAFEFINFYAVLLNNVPEQVMFLAQYICELSLLDGEPYMRFLPSLIASGAMALARCIAKMPIWSDELEAATTYTAKDLKDVLLHLNKTHVSAESLSQQAIQRKYKSSKYQEVALIEALEIDEQRLQKVLNKFYTTNNANC